MGWQIDSDGFQTWVPDTPEQFALDYGADNLASPDIYNDFFYDDWGVGSDGAGGMASGGPSFLSTLGSSVANLPWQSILGGAAGLGTIAGLFQNDKYPGGSTTGTQHQLPPWWEAGAMQGVSEAGSIGPYESQLDTPGTMLRNIDIGEYMNPFIQQTLDPVLRNMDIEQAAEQNQLAANAAKVGAFGGSRPALDQSLALERQGRRRDEAIGTAYRGAYDKAQEGALSDIGRTWGDIAVRYEDPYRQVGALGDMLANTKTVGDTTQTVTQAKRSPWETLAGAGMTGLGLYNEMFGNKG